MNKIKRSAWRQGYLAINWRLELKHISNNKLIYVDQYEDIAQESMIIADNIISKLMLKQS